MFYLLEVNWKVWGFLALKYSIRTLEHYAICRLRFDCKFYSKNVLPFNFLPKFSMPFWTRAQHEGPVKRVFCWSENSVSQNLYIRFFCSFCMWLAVYNRQNLTQPNLGESTSLPIFGQKGPKGRIFLCFLQSSEFPRNNCIWKFLLQTPYLVKFLVLLQDPKCTEISKLQDFSHSSVSRNTLYSLILHVNRYSL